MNRGRPIAAPEERRSKRIPVSLTEAEYEQIQHFANLTRRSAAEYLYNIIRDHIDEMNRDDGDLS